MKTRTRHFSSITSAALALVIVCLGYTQVSGQIWVREVVYGGANADNGYNVHTTSDFGCITIGHTTSFGNPLTMPNVHIGRLDPQANPVWMKTYDIQSTGWEYSIKECQNGDFIWTCGVINPADGTNDVIIVRTDNAGNIIWAQSVQSPFNEQTASIIETANGDIVVAGETDFPNTGGQRDVFVIRTSAAGAFIWATVVGHPDGDEWGRCVRETMTGNLVVVGGTNSFDAGDAYAIGLSGAGALLWGHRYGGSGVDEFYTVAVGDFADCVMVASGGYDIGTGATEDLYLVRFDGMGNAMPPQVTYDFFDAPDRGWFVNNSTVAIDQFVVTGQTSNSAHGNIDVITMEIDQFLNPIWQNVYGSPQNDVGRAIWDIADNQTAGAGYWVFGTSDGFGIGSTDHYLLRMSPIGQTGCEIELMEPPVSVGHDIVVEPMTNSYDCLNPISFPNTGGCDFLEVCAGQFITYATCKRGGHENGFDQFGVSPTTGESPVAGETNLETYPNPIARGGDFHIHYSAQQSSVARLTISDAQGRIVFEGDQEVSRGVNDIAVNTTNWSIGAYVVRIETEGFVTTVRLMVTE